MKLSLNELPDCQCGKGKMLPIEDVSQQGTAYLKGWFCTTCNTAYLFKSGVITIEMMYPSLKERG